MEQRRDAGPGLAPPVATWTRPLTWLLFLLLALVAGGLSSFSVGANLLVVGVGGVLFWLGMARAGATRQRLPLRPPRRARWWLVPLAGLAVVEVVGYAMGSTHDYPTLSGLADPWLERYPVRAAAFFGWTAAFWAMARR